MAKSKEAAKRPRVTNLSHIALYARDVERSIAFYRDVLGYYDVQRQMGADGRLEAARIRVNGLQYVELLPERKPESDRLDKFGFVTDDAEAMRAFLASEGIDVPAKVSGGQGENTWFRVKDPDGHVVELVQYDRGAWPILSKGNGSDGERISTCLMHIGFTSYSLDKSMAFYHDVLGCKEMWRGSRDKKQLSWVQLTLSDSIDYIEFMLYDAFPSLERLGVLNHFGLEVPDIRNAKELLEGRRAFAGYTRPIDPVIGVCHHRILNTFDPDGTRAELMERATYDGAPRPSTHEPPPR